MTSSLSIYDSEQYLFEIAQSFIRSRIIFTSIELKIFDLLLSYNDGLICSQIAEHLNLHFIENESRCLQDVLDCLTSMNFLERDDEKLSYKLTKFTRNYLLPNRTILSNIDEEFYKEMPRFHDIILNNSSSKNTFNQIMLLRIKQFIDLTNYSNISIDSFDENTDVIILWRQDSLLKEKIKQAYDILPSNKKGLLILIIPNDEYDEVTLAFNLFMNMTTTNKEQENSKDIYSKKFLKQIGFRSIERIQSTDDLQLLLAYK
jgi:hypothetical protein